VLEAESESHVNRLTRELSALRLAQQQQQQQEGSGSISPETRLNGIRSAADATDPAFETMLEALKRENEQLRGRLVSTERNFIRMSRLNDIYREELISHRRRVSRWRIC
jgi:hypothetical protein